MKNGSIGVASRCLWAACAALSIVLAVPVSAQTGPPENIGPHIREVARGDLWTIWLPTEEEARSSVTRHAEIYQQLAAESHSRKARARLLGWSLMDIEVQSREGRFNSYRARAVVQVWLEAKPEEDPEGERLAPPGAGTEGPVASIEAERVDVSPEAIEALDDALVETDAVIKRLMEVVADPDLRGVWPADVPLDFAQRVSANMQRLATARGRLEDGEVGQWAEISAVIRQLEEDIDRVPIATLLSQRDQGQKTLDLYEGLRMAREDALHALDVARIEVKYEVPKEIVDAVQQQEVRALLDSPDPDPLAARASGRVTQRVPDPLARRGSEGADSSRAGPDPLATRSGGGGALRGQPADTSGRRSGLSAPTREASASPFAQVREELALEAEARELAASVLTLEQQKHATQVAELSARVAGLQQRAPRRYLYVTRYRYVAKLRECSGLCLMPTSGWVLSDVSGHVEVFVLEGFADWANSAIGEQDTYAYDLAGFRSIDASPVDGNHSDEYWLLHDESGWWSGADGVGRITLPSVPTRFTTFPELEEALADLRALEGR